MAPRVTQQSTTKGKQQKEPKLRITTVHYSSWTPRMKGDKLLQRPCSWSAETGLSVQNPKHFPGPLCYPRQSRTHVRQHLPLLPSETTLGYSLIIHDSNRPFPDRSTFFCRSPPIWSTYQQLLQVKSIHAMPLKEIRIALRWRRSCIGIPCQAANRRAESTKGYARKEGRIEESISRASRESGTLQMGARFH